ncbi:MAG: hypothetical protein P1P84_23870 [Deferrisomatales bacterium]|nr:hypothetical protein [Deferrisomatales bacterium]
MPARAVPTPTRTIGDRSGYHVLRTCRRPYRFPHYHGLGDTPEELNHGKMASIARPAGAR